MRKVILNVAVSLDGYIEGPAGEYDWCLADQDYGMATFFEDTDAIFIGRKSYELIRAEQITYPDKKIYVFSDTMQAEQDAGIEVIPSTDLYKTVTRIREQPGKSIWLFGGASLVSAFINKNLVSELLLSVHPILLGNGKPLFENMKDQTRLELLEQTVYDTGLVQLRYSVNPKFDMDLLKML
jgi:dihydrofolate reductase